jgi:hypothetical protein
MRLGSGMEGNAPNMNRFLDKPTSFVSLVYQGFGVIRINSGGDIGWGQQSRLLNHLFRGNEYRLDDVRESPGDAYLDGRPFTSISNQPFQISVNSGGAWQTALLDASSGIYFVPPYNVPHPQVQFIAEHSRQIRLIRQALPAWMSAAK